LCSLTYQISKPHTIQPATNIPPVPSSDLPDPALALGLL
jgi:hypothetical protein